MLTTRMPTRQRVKPPPPSSRTPLRHGTITGMNRRVTVVGAGVVGLSSAVLLAEAGHPVDVLARELPLETTSATAGGLWLPFLAEPADQVAAGPGPPWRPFSTWPGRLTTPGSRSGTATCSTVTRKSRAGPKVCRNCS